MKRIILLVFICITSWTFTSLAQDNEKRFFFKNFQEMEVYYKDGRAFKVAGNYDLIGGSFVFIDKQDDNQLKEFGEQEKIAAVKTGNRTFYATRFGPTEVVQADPEFLVFYKPHILEGKKKAGYGTTTSAGSVRSLSRFVTMDPHSFQTMPGQTDPTGAPYTVFSSNGSTQAVSIESDPDWVGQIERVYTIKVKGKEKRFNTEKSFLKIFPKQAEEIQKYIADNQVSFDSASQVMEMVKTFNK